MALGETAKRNLTSTSVMSSTDTQMCNIFGDT